MIANLVVVLGLLISVAQAKWNFDEYKCSVCIPTFQQMIDDKDINFQKVCSQFFNDDICGHFHVDMSGELLAKFPRLNAREHCQRLNYCPSDSDYPAASAGTVDVRVTRALGSKGYDKMRLSVISNSTISSPYFTYSKQFQYRWTDKYLSTGIVSVTPGQTTTLSVAGKTVNIRLPKDGEGIKGVILADPCFTNDWIVCVYKDKYQTFKRVPELLNAMVATNELSYWQILGDNFYDQEGGASSSWFASLSDATKATPLAVTPGNHDFWVNAMPQLSVPKDQYGNGLMQFYAQDTLAASSTSPYDFSINPDGSYGRDRGENIPPASNYFFYNKIGNVAFIGYSGAHNWASQTSYFTDACNWAASTNPSVVLLLGHWNSDGDGCTSDATVPMVYQEMKSLPACAPIVNKLKYFEGHKHCNLVMEKDNGFMVGGGGMSDHECMGDFGFPVVDTTGGSFKVYYFNIAHSGDFDNYDAILNCIKSKGVAGCYSMATKWVDVPV